MSSHQTLTLVVCHRFGVALQIWVPLEPVRRRLRPGSRTQNLCGPVDVALDFRGDVFVADAGNNRALRCGQPSNGTQPPGGTQPSVRTDRVGGPAKGDCWSSIQARLPQQTILPKPDAATRPGDVPAGELNGPANKFRRIGSPRTRSKCLRGGLVTPVVTIVWCRLLCVSSALRPSHAMRVAAPNAPG
jgi:hypothetical protein